MRDIAAWTDPLMPRPTNCVGYINFSWNDEGGVTIICRRNDWTTQVMHMSPEAWADFKRQVIERG